MRGQIKWNVSQVNAFSNCHLSSEGCLSRKRSVKWKLNQVRTLESERSVKWILCQVKVWSNEYLFLSNVSQVNTLSSERLVKWILVPVKGQSSEYFLKWKVGQVNVWTGAVSKAMKKIVYMYIHIKDEDEVRERLPQSFHHLHPWESAPPASETTQDWSNHGTTVFLLIVSLTISEKLQLAGKGSSWGITQWKKITQDLFGKSSHWKPVLLGHCSLRSFGTCLHGQ